MKKCVKTPKRGLSFVSRSYTLLFECFSIFSESEEALFCLDFYSTLYQDKVEKKKNLIKKTITEQKNQDYNYFFLYFTKAVGHVWNTYTLNLKEQ
jgi:hypothetical protein